MRFRPLERADFDLLGRWIRAPHVAPWWRHDGDGSAVVEAFGPCLDGSDPTEVFVVEGAAGPVGIIQRYWLCDFPDWQAAVRPAGAAEPALGIDYLIGEESLIGRGLGPEMIDAFVTQTLRQHPEAAAIVVAVQQANRRSWRALEKAGFTRASAGSVDSTDPSDEGPQYLYLRSGPGSARSKPATPGGMGDSPR